MRVFIVDKVVDQDTSDGGGGGQHSMRGGSTTGLIGWRRFNESAKPAFLSDQWTHLEKQTFRAAA